MSNKFIAVTYCGYSGPEPLPFPHLFEVSELSANQIQWVIELHRSSEIPANELELDAAVDELPASRLHADQVEKLQTQVSEGAALTYFQMQPILAGGCIPFRGSKP